MELLDMTALDLIKKGFAQEIKNEGVTYKLPTINGYFMFNPEQKVYRWYHVTVLGELKNSVSLKMENEDQLDMIIKLFNQD